MYIEELRRKMMVKSQNTDLDLHIFLYKGNKQKNHVVGWSTDLDFIECICGIREKKDGWELKYRFGPLLMYEGYKQKNHGIETKYRFGFAYIYIKELTEKSWDWAEVQIWIWLNINEGNGHKNDGWRFYSSYNVEIKREMWEQIFECILQLFGKMARWQEGTGNMQMSTRGRR